MSRGRTTGLVLLTSLLGSLAVAPSPSGAAPAPTRGGGHCVHQSRIDVPGAPVQRVDCLDDLTTASTVATNHTDASDWAGLNAPGTHNPSGVPGIQVDGYFPDTSTSNTHHGWNHDSQFVVRLPDHWNGRLVVSGAPGTRTQYAGDFLFSDWLLAHGYAYAMTDKGNDGSSFYKDGKEPGDAIAEWNHRVTQLTRATRQVVAQRYGRVPARTYLFGISNGGYLVRWQLENRPGLYDGGVDWEGTLYQAKAPNLLTYLPVALRNYPKYQATGDRAAHRRMIRAGFARGSEFTWDYHYSVYWDLTQRLYREELDPSYDGAQEAGTPFCQSGDPRLRRRLPLRAASPGAPGAGEGRADRRHQAADDHPARHHRRAAADPHRLRRLPPGDPPPRPHRPAPLLPDRRRHPRRRPERRVRRPGPADPPLRPPSLRATHRLGRVVAAAPAQRHHPA
ncbi:tannase/feruloyl esterase family alpha/beta hydrolase [Nocardioides ungokensis]